MIMFHLCPDRYTSYKKITTTTWGPMKRKSSSPLWVGRKSTHTHTHTWPMKKKKPWNYTWRVFLSFPFSEKRETFFHSLLCMW
jgi:hypothetical protein